MTNIFAVQTAVSDEGWASMEALSESAGRLLQQAVDAEAAAFIDDYRGLRDGRGRQRVVHNGYSVARKIRTCMGEHTIRVPRVRDLAGDLRFKSRILSPYQRRTEGQRERFAAAYRQGLVSGDFHEALSALMGQCVVYLAPTARTRLSRVWQANCGQGANADIDTRSQGSATNSVRLAGLPVSGVLDADQAGNSPAPTRIYSEIGHSWFQLLRASAG